MLCNMCIDLLECEGAFHSMEFLSIDRIELEKYVWVLDQWLLKSRSLGIDLWIILYVLQHVH
jgi:hypothetical protein